MPTSLSYFVISLTPGARGTPGKLGLVDASKPPGDIVAVAAKFDLEEDFICLQPAAPATSYQDLTEDKRVCISIKPVTGGTPVLVPASKKSLWTAFSVD